MPQIEVSDRRSGLDRRTAPDRPEVQIPASYERRDGEPRDESDHPLVLHAK